MTSLPHSELAQTAPSAVKRVLLVDDHPICVYGLKQMLMDAPGFTVVGEAANGQAALAAMRELHPHIALVDISMPGTNGIELLKMMLAEQPGLIVVMLSVHDETLYALRALRAGARGYLMKQQATECVIEALTKVAGGGLYVSPQFSERLIFKAIAATDDDLGTPVDKLSDRELEVLQWLGRRRSTREIAELLHLSVKTVETHRANLKTKLGFTKGDDVVKFAIEWTAMMGEGESPEGQ